MGQKSILFILIDALRYDVLSDPVAAAALAPNLARLASSGFVLRCVTNAQATQFVMPALFSSTYPLDYGGYNDGILHRPASYVEILRAGGYRTCLAASCNMLTPGSGYDRGFDEVHTASDYRHLLDYRIDKTLRYHLQRWRAGEISTDETVAVVAPDLDRVLDGIETDIRKHGSMLWPPRLRRRNENVAAGVPAERELLRSDPKAVLDKLVSLPPVMYWRWLGRRHVNPVARFWHRALESVRWRSRRFAAKYNIPIFILTVYQVIAGEVFDGLAKLLPQLRRPWYIHMHVMDLHDCFVQSRPLHMFAKLRYLPRYLRARWTGATRRHPLYDLALCYVDGHVGRLLKALEAEGRMDDLIIVVTGDHGNRYADSPRSKRDVAVRTNFEDIEVPILVWGAGSSPDVGGLMDSMGVSATLLDLCGLAPHPSFKGVSAYAGGRAAVITESAGSGNADVTRRDLYFTITTQSHRMMTVLRGSALEVLKLFDLSADPRELEDLSADPGQAQVIDAMLSHLYAERGELLAMRGADRPGDAPSLRTAS